MHKSKTSSRLFTILLTLIMVLGILPISTFAAGGTESTIKVYMTFEGYNLGQGFYIEPTAIEIPAGSTVGEATILLLSQTGA